MRNLSSIESTTNINASIKIGVTPVDQSTTFVFSQWNIQNMTPVQYEIDFLGGFGKSSTYQLTLSNCLDFWKDNFKKFIKAEVALTMTVNEDEFTPHIGIVQDITRFPNDPNLIEFQVFDKFFDNVPKYPVAAIVDSYTGVHPEVSNNDWGYPSYYGKHARPFYMTPVDCDLGSLVGPINVSSENHVSSLYFNRQKELGYYGEHNLLLNQTWNQQSGSNNLTISNSAFEVHDMSTTRSIWKFTGAELSYSNVDSSGAITFWSNKNIDSNFGATPNAPFEIQFYIRPELIVDPGLLIHRTQKIFYSASIVNTPTPTPRLFRGILQVSSGHQRTASNMFAVLNQNFFNGTHIINSPVDKMGNGYDNPILELYYATSSFLAFPSEQFSCHWQATLKSENYTNYSIYAKQVNCSDIAISENPIHILTDIYSQSGLGFRQSQASDTQANLASSGFNFQCFFGQRESLTAISQEFGEVTGTYIFISDSGQINFRTYQESAEASIDAVITPDNYFEGSLVIRDNPLGTTVFDTEKAKRLSIQYNYNFTTQTYENVLTADPNNTAACNSIAATGVNNEIIKETKYILESGTTSLYLSNLIRKRTKDEQIIECNLPAQYFNLELADVVRLEHPILQGSESLYQITRLKHDYLNGQVGISATELVSL